MKKIIVGNHAVPWGLRTTTPTDRPEAGSKDEQIARIRNDVDARWRVLTRRVEHGT